MNNLLASPKTAVAAVALATAVLAVAGPAQVVPVGSLSLSPEFIVDSPAYLAKRRAQAAQQRLSRQPLCCVDGVITSPAYL